VLQEVYKGLLVRNQGKCPFDPTKGSFGHYVTMVCQCVFTNYHVREQRRRRQERLGAVVLQGDEWESTDAAVKAMAAPHEAPEWESLQVRECMNDLVAFIMDHEESYRRDFKLAQNAKLAPLVLPMVLQGKKRGEIAAELGYGGPSIGRALAFLRRAAHEWVCAQHPH